MLDKGVSTSQTDFSSTPIVSQNRPTAAATYSRFENMSNGSDQYVKERPAWLIPVAVALGVSLFSALFGYYYFGPTPSEILGLDPRASDSSEKVDMMIGDERFLIPANFTRYPLQRVGGTQDEIDLHALLPELAPYTANRQAAFENNAPDASVVHIKIHRANGLMPAARRLDDIYARHLYSRTPESGAAGLSLYRFAEGTGYKDQELYVADQPDGQPLLILCFKHSDVIFSPNCTRTFHLTDTVAVTYRYKRAQLENWQSTDQAIIALVRSFITELLPETGTAEDAQ